MCVMKMRTTGPSTWARISSHEGSSSPSPVSTSVQPSAPRSRKQWTWRGPLGSGSVTRRIPGSTSTGVANVCSITLATGMRVEYREEPCRSALNRVQGMPFEWSLNPYMGCAHRCTFCYVRAFELRADRPADERYGASIRVKTNVAEVLRREVARASWQRDGVAIGTATDPYQPAEGRYRLTRACLEVLSAAANPFAIITRGPMILRDLDVLVEAARRANVSVTFSIPTIDVDVWRRHEPGTAPPHQRLRALTERAGPAARPPRAARRPRAAQSRGVTSTRRRARARTAR